MIIPDDEEFMESPYGMLVLTNKGNYVATDMCGVPLPASELVKLVNPHISDAEYEERVLQEQQDREARMRQYTNRNYLGPHEGYIYAVRVNDKLKLGRTKNEKSRFSEYKRSCTNFEILCQKKVGDCVSAEKELLTKFSDGKTEWLSHSPELADSVSAYFKTCT